MHIGGLSINVVRCLSMCAIMRLQAALAVLCASVAMVTAGHLGTLELQDKAPLWCFGTGYPIGTAPAGCLACCLACFLVAGQPIAYMVCQPALVPEGMVLPHLPIKPASARSAASLVMPASCLLSLLVRQTLLLPPPSTLFVCLLPSARRCCAGSAVRLCCRRHVDQPVCL